MSRLASVMVLVVVSAACSPSSGCFDLTGNAVDPMAAGGTAGTVLLFVATDCPISNRYAPEIRQIVSEFGSRGVNFWLVYPNRDDTQELIREHVEAFDYSFAVVRDERHSLVRLAGASVTPEAAVFEPGGRLVYRGRIDDRFVAFGKTRPAPTRRDLREALQALVDGRAPEELLTHRAVGCFIQDLE